MKVWDIPVKIHPLTPVMAMMALWLGEWERMLVMAASLLLHEGGHLAAARAAGVEVTELEILPLGGAIRLRGAWEMRPAQLLCVAMAGPAMNLMMACAATVAGKPMWVNGNLVLMLFNLLPALPLDGGRALAGLLSFRMRLTRAVRAAVWGGWIVSAILLGLFAESCAAGQANVTFLLAAAYMFLCARREMALADAAGVRSLLSRQRELERERALPVRFLMMPENMSAREAALRLSPRHVHVICLCSEDMCLKGMIGEKEVAKWALKDGGRLLSEIAEDVMKRKTKENEKNGLLFCGFGAIIDS